MRQALKFVIVYLLRAYKWAISPFFPPSCRYVPTCSEYAMEAVDRYGAWRGGAMAIWRLLRCHPFVQGGYDPVLPSRACHSERSEESAFSSSASRHLRGETNLAPHPNALALDRTVH